MNHLKTTNEFKRAINATNLVVVDFASTWCNPCKMLAPHLEQLANLNQDVYFYKVDVDALSDVASEENISAMPTIKFYKNGRALDKVVGANLSEIKTKLKYYQNC